MECTVSENSPWGQLVFTNESRPPVVIKKDTITLGRKEGCDVSFVNCKFVSGHHCSISQDENGKVWLQDFSTNGSLLNGRKVSKNEKVQICHNDQVQIVHRKENPEYNIAFFFQDLKFLEQEAALLDNTQEYHVETEEDSSVEEEKSDSNRAESSSLKRTHSQTGDVDPCPESTKDDQTTVDKKPRLTEHNSIAATLVCSICQDIFHDCISLQPCLHCFCAACYSQWMEQSNECPSCREKVERISKNHIVNNLVEAFLKEHPERRRPDEELREMDSKNKITEVMLRAKRKRRTLLEYDGDDDEYDGDGDDDDDEEEEEGEEFSDSDGPGSYPGDVSHASVAIGAFHSSFGSLFGFSSFRSSMRPVPTRCRQCPGYISPGPSSAVSHGEGTSTYSSTPDYTCTPSQTHLLCLCCMQPMPDRRTDASDGSLPPQNCSVCHKAFCHLYWGCRAAGCLGCLNKFEELKFGENCLLSLINNCQYESKVLKDYLVEKGLTEQDLLQICMVKLDSKGYTSVDSATHNVSSSTILCHNCGLRNFRDLAYQFRRDIPRDQLPESVTSRPDCYWGKNCRTQKSKPLHASRYNHICEQTRFT